MKLGRTGERVSAIGMGGYQMYKGIKAKFREELKLGEMSVAEERWFTRLGRVGHCARGIAWRRSGIFEQGFLFSEEQI